MQRFFMGILTAGLSTLANAVPNVLIDDWYQVEVLIFVRDDALTSVDEQWEPLPSLSYLDAYDHLVIPELASRRMNEAGAVASAIDSRGFQTLTVPRTSSPLDSSLRPDALIGEPYIDPEVAPGADPEAGALYDVPPLLAAPEPATLESLPLEPELEEDVPEFDSVSLVRPEMAIRRSDLAFRGQARTLRRRGQRVLFHESWWSRLAEDGPATQIALDRGSDMDVEAWPELQGSLRIYRSRYLHIDVDVWLNTMAPYFIEGWQIDAPPLPERSLESHTLSGEPLNPWMPTAIEPVGLYTWDTEENPIDARAVPVTPDQGSGGDNDAPDKGVPGDSTTQVEPDPDQEGAPGADEVIYPFKHAIRHAQSRRMRSTEVHYLDHPVIGVIVRIMPADAERLPLADEEDLAFRELHGIPVETLDLPLDWATGDP